MLERIIDRNISFLQKYSSCNEEQVAVYKYALQILYTYLIDITVLFSVSYCFGRLYKTVIMTFVFAVLQVFGGGYHADTKLRCFLTMMAGCVVGNVLIDFASRNISIVAIVAIVVSIVIFPLVPIINTNHPVTKKVYKRSKRVSRTIISCIAFFIIILIILGMDTEASSVAVTLLLYLMSLFGAIYSVRLKKQKNIGKL